MSYDEQEFEQLVDGETLDSDDIEYKLALRLVKLAMGVLQQQVVGTPYPASLLVEALDALHHYGNWRKEGPIRALLTPKQYRQFLIKDSNEEEADAEIYYEAFHKKLLASPTRELWYSDPQGVFHRFRRYDDEKVGKDIFIYARGTMGHETVILIPGEERLAFPYLADLVRQVREKYAFDLYGTPLDPWTLTPHGDIH
jgi:hypothetical protein